MNPLDIFEACMDIIARRLRMLRSSGSGGFTPLDLQLGAWYSADVGVYQTAGQWNDQSGNANHATQATAGFRAASQMGVQNGLPGLLFDGTDDFFSLTSPIAAASYVAVFSRPSAGIKSSPFGRNNATPLEAPAWWTDNTLYGAFSATERTDGTVTTTGPFLTTVTKNGASSVIRLNGVAGSWNGELSGTFECDQLGRISTSHYHTGYLFELIIGAPGVVFTAGEILLLEAYLNAKWGVY